MTSDSSFNFFAEILFFVIFSYFLYVFDSFRFSVAISARGKLITCYLDAFESKLYWIFLNARRQC